MGDPPEESLRKLKGAIWELDLAERVINLQTKKSSCICKCKVDKNNPVIVCNKKLVLTQGSTSSLRHHIKAHHPSDWTRLVQLESERADRAASDKAELAKVISEAEGSNEEEEEDLTTPTTPGQKRPAAAEADLVHTPKSKRAKPNPVTPARSIFHRVQKYNVRDKKQLYFDLRLTSYLIGNNFGYETLATEASKKWFEEFNPQYHLKHPTTFSR